MKSDTIALMTKQVIFSVIVIVAVLGGWHYYQTKNGTQIKPEKTFQELFNPEANSSATSNSASQNVQTPVAQAPISNPTKKYMNATLHTNKGDITIEFFDKQTPNTVANFVKLAESGFYSNVKFHRVIKDFMIQGGDPLTKDDSKVDQWGTGGPGYTFADELTPENKNNAGTISMANAGPNTNGSQFFINLKDNNFLDTKHTVFGKVIKGMDVVQAIGLTQTGVADRPVSPIIIQSVTLQ